MLSSSLWLAHLQDSIDERTHFDDFNTQIGVRCFNMQNSITNIFKFSQNVVTATNI